MMLKNVILYSATIIASLSALLSPSLGQELKLDTENVITITEKDGRRSAGRFKDFFLDVNQGDRLTFDIKGKGGVSVPTIVELYPTKSPITDFRSRNAENNLRWTSEPLPACKLTVRIIAYQPYGAITVFVTKSNPNDDSPSTSSSSAVVAGADAISDDQGDLGKMSKEQLLKKHQQLLMQLQRIASELARRK